MKLIPVLDLLQGHVVHARRGQRTGYSPIQSSLCKGSNAINIASALLDVFPFRSFYIADLDSIQGQGNNTKLIIKLRERFPDLDFWVDSGIATRTDYVEWKNKRLGRTVIGSENHPEPALMKILDQENVPLSLDFLDDKFIGEPTLQSRPEAWPRDVIVMSLAHVGSNLGPDIDRLISIKRLAPTKSIFAAGGVHDVKDLEALKRIGISGALLASALHNGKIAETDIQGSLAADSSL